MTSATRIWGGNIRKLRASEADGFKAHLMRLDSGSRRMRFAHTVSDTFIDEYASRMGDPGGIVVAYIHDGAIRASAELKKLGDTWGREAEAAFAVETEVQDQGLGTVLMGRIIRLARNRGVQLLYMSCLPENAKMQSIARKYEAELRIEYGEVVGEIVPQGPDYFSILAEQIEDRVGMMMTVLDLSNRSVKAA